MTKKKDPQEIRYQFAGNGLTNEEKVWGQKRFNEYRESYPHLNKRATLQMVEEVVWMECLQEKYKKQIGDRDKIYQENLAKGVTSNNEIPKYLQESIADGMRQITELKTKLGLFEDQKMTDAFKDFQLMKDKAAEYRRTHPLVFKTTCPFCARAYALKRRTEHFEEFISPFLEEKILNNKPLFALYKSGKLTKEDVAAVLGTSPKYVDWLDEKVYGNKVKKAEATIIEPPTSEPIPAPPESTPEAT